MATPVVSKLSANQQHGILRLAAAPRRNMMGTKVPSMLFDLEMEEPVAQGCDETFASAVVACRRATLNTLTPATVQVATAVEAVVAASGHECPDCSLLAQALVEHGYKTCLRQTVGGGAGGQCLRNLHHSFLCCWQGEQFDSTANGMDGSTVIVDPSFRDQFTIAHPTPRYTAVLAALPAVLVCQADRIQPLVELLCAEMALAFHGMGIVLPPWRYAKSMLSKWLPRRGSVDLNLSLPANAASAAAAPAPAALMRQACLGGPGAVASLGNRTTGAGATANSALLKCSAGHPADGCSAGGGSRSSSMTCFNNSHHSGSSSSGSSSTGSSHEGSHGASNRLLGGCHTLVATSAIAVPPAGTGQLIPPRPKPQQPYEPLQRVVGGFGFSAIVATSG